VRLRVPDWVVAAGPTLLVNDQRRDLVWEGRYLRLAPLAAGSRVSLRYPLREQVEGFSVNEETTHATWLGGTVVDVVPDQGPVPIYRRQQVLIPAPSPGSTAACDVPGARSAQPLARGRRPWGG
jgi:hypothetical protein